MSTYFLERLTRPAISTPVTAAAPAMIPMPTPVSFNSDNNNRGARSVRTNVAVACHGLVDQLPQRLGLHVLGLDGEEEVCRVRYVRSRG